jgi:hypothetical protein
MGDVLVGAVPAPAAPVEAAAKVNPVVAAREARAAKLVSVGKALAAALPSELPAPAEKPVVEAKPVEAKPEPVEAEPTADEPKVEAKTEELKVEEHDAKTKKALEAIDKQAKKFRDEQLTAKREFEQKMLEERTAFAREKQELAARYGSAEELAKLAERDPLALIRKLRPNMTEDDWEVIGRGAFPFTKAGKNDPRAAEAAKRLEKESTRDSEIAQIRKEYDERIAKLETDRKQAEAQTFVERWTSDAMKAIPPTSQRSSRASSRRAPSAPSRRCWPSATSSSKRTTTRRRPTPRSLPSTSDASAKSSSSAALTSTRCCAPPRHPLRSRARRSTPKHRRAARAPSTLPQRENDKLAAVSQGLQKLSSET